MAGHGPAPLARRVRARNEPELRRLRSSGALHGRPLPKGVLPDGQTWHKQTLAMWSALRRSPLLEHEPEIGWQFLIDTALMHHTMWTKGRWDFASEVRLRLAKFGATPEDRLRLKVQIDATPQGDAPAAAVPRPAADGTVTEIRSRRARLLDD